MPERRASAPPAQPQFCGTHDCLPLYIDGGESIVFAVGDRIRYLVLEGPDAQILAELYVSPGEHFQEVVPSLEELLGNMVFAGG